MVIEGTKKENADKETNADNRWKPDEISGLLRLGNLLFLALVLLALVLATMPGSARVDEGAVTLPAADQSSGCPCSGNCGPQQAPPVAQPQIAETSTLNQPVPESYSSPGTVQQPPAESASAVNTPPVATSEQKSVNTGPVTNNKSIIDMPGSFSMAGITCYMPSLSADNIPRISMPGSDFMEKMKIKWPMFS